MTAAELAQVWVPVPMRWRNIAAGDVIVGKDGKLWTVAEHVTHNVSPENGWPQGMLGIRVTCGTAEHRTPHIDPDEVATVLLPAALRDAMELSRDELGARLLERRGAA